MAVLTAESTDRERVKEAFKTMRAAGITARMNFKCCMGCALTAFENEGKKDDDDIAYFHGQDEDAFYRQTAWGRRRGEGKTLQRDLMIRHTTPMAARVALAALIGAGLKATWDGDEDRCVIVKATAVKDEA